MDTGQRNEAKRRLVAGMRRGLPWHTAAHAAGLATGRATAYRLARRARLGGDSAVCDRRHGQRYKMSGPVRDWLAAYCRGAPQSSGAAVQLALRERFDLSVSLSQINRVRAALGLSRRRGAGGKAGGRSVA